MISLESAIFVFSINALAKVRDTELTVQEINWA